VPVVLVAHVAVHLRVVAEVQVVQEDNIRL
jgi:hypothetical protein